MLLPETLAQQLITTLSTALWQRPELTRLREPIETALKGNEFKKLTHQAFEHVLSDLPYFDTGLIEMPRVQEQLAAYIMEGQSETVTELERLYHKRLPAGEKPTADVRSVLETYLRRVRQVFVTHPAYGGLILARGQDAMLEAISVFRREVHDRLETLSSEQKSGFEEILKHLETLFKEPEIKALIERKQGTHIFLSYTRRNAEQAAQIRQALEAAGHMVWQDTTALKGGAEWIDSIADGIKRAYAVVSVVSEQSQQSKWVQIEYLEAERRGKMIVPIRVDGCEIPMIMLVLNVVHGHPDLPAGIKKLIEALPTPHAGEVLQQKLERADPRQLELDYLNKMLLEYAVWQEVYTPMAGVGHLRKAKPTADNPVMVTTPTDIGSKFKLRLKESKLQAPEPVEMEQQTFTDILPAIEKLRQLVVLGDPGAGKTTTLWKIAVDAAQKAKDDPAAPLPVLIRLGALNASLPFQEQIANHLGGNLEVAYSTLLKSKRLIFLLDGLNELPKGITFPISFPLEFGSGSLVKEIQELVKLCQDKDISIVVTCRELDYQGALELGIAEKVVITPLDPPRIYRFVKSYIEAPPEAADHLFWELAGNQAHQQWQQFSKAVGEPMDIFWLATELPDGKRWGYDWDERRNNYWEDWLEERQQPRSLLQLATNPFMLYMITQVYTEEGKLPSNRGALFALFISFLLEEREKLAPDVSLAIQDRLADLGFEMQKQGEGTTFSKEKVLHYLGETPHFYRAQSASLLTGDEDIRFTHQLLQEYFAARRLDREMQNGTDARQFFPVSNWWQPQGWEETAILLAGLYSDDCSPVVEWLRDAQPELAVRCVQESGAAFPEEAVERLALQKAWLPRLTDLNTDPEPEARSAVGRVLGRLNLDNRKGVGLTGNGLPDIDWVEIPTGKFIYGDNRQVLALPTFYMSRHPITMVQFQAFLDAPDGYANPAWFEGLAADSDDRQMEEQYFKVATHPRETVNWYQAVAFCRWLSWKLGGVYGVDEVEKWRICLPTEQEWEKAGRGTDGRIYPYGNEFDAAKGNTRETGIGQTSAVGIFPGGASPYGVLDMSGNVWEWCLTEYESAISNIITNSNGRVLRGGVWCLDQYNARAASRSNHPPRRSSPYFRLGSVGFRVVCRPY